MATVLSTDLYELTMAAGYYANRACGLATFELYVHDLPAQRSFLVAAGLEQALKHLETLRFTPEEIQYLRSLPAPERVPTDFFDRYLPGFRFTGEVWAVPEGTPVFCAGTTAPSDGAGSGGANRRDRAAGHGALSDSDCYQSGADRRSCARPAGDRVRRPSRSRHRGSHACRPRRVCRV